ncbi:MAG: hypothetical protein JSS27_16700 [Planctomycetes bacterium]|nr:hypothetical protein [Planctomycetota bacterium]
MSTVMNEIEFHLTLEGNRRHYLPGELLTCQLQCNSFALDEPRAIELSVVWTTEGQGDEDMAVHFFERLHFDDQSRRQLREGMQFNTLLPQSPLTYEGVLMKIFWCVRARIFRWRGKELVVEEPFRLGNVPAVPLPEADEV